MLFASPLLLSSLIYVSAVGPTAVCRAKWFRVGCCCAVAKEIPSTITDELLERESESGCGSKSASSISPPSPLSSLSHLYPLSHKSNLPPSGTCTSGYAGMDRGSLYHLAAAEHGILLQLPHAYTAYLFRPPGRELLLQYYMHTETSSNRAMLSGERNNFYLRGGERYIFSDEVCVCVQGRVDGTQSSVAKREICWPAAVD